MATSPGALIVVTMATQQAIIAYHAHKQTAGQEPPSASQAALPVHGVSARGADTGGRAWRGDHNTVDMTVDMTVDGSPRLESVWDDSSKAASQTADKHVGGV